jgi:hypothetical protein
MHENRIKHLEDVHKSLDKLIDTLERTGIYGDFQIEDLKKKKLQIKDELAKIKDKQQNVEKIYVGEKNLQK